MRTPNMIFTGAVLAAVIAVGLYFFGPREPNVVGPPPADVVVPLEHPPATGGNGEPPTGQPEPVEPPDVVPLDHPPATGGNGEPPNANQPTPVVPPTSTPPTNGNTGVVPPWLRPPYPQEEGPFIHPRPEKKPVVHKPHKPKPHVKKPKPKPHVKKPHVKKPKVKKPARKYVAKGVDPKLWDMQRHYFYWKS